jgi:acyl transferase domain-containing protein
MASLACGRDEAEAICREVPGLVVLANLNSPRQMVVSGDAPAVEDVIARAGARGIVARRLPVSNASTPR